jgi:hypothetical protein
MNLIKFPGAHVQSVSSVRLKASHVHGYSYSYSQFLDNFSEPKAHQDRHHAKDQCLSVCLSISHGMDCDKTTTPTNALLTNPQNFIRLPRLEIQ